MRIIGLMSGTSLDGVDAALLETDGETIFATGRALTHPFAPALRARLRALLDRAEATAPDDPALRDTTEQLTLHHAEAVRALGEPADLIGFHGQTILHRPDQRRTWQIGDAALLADVTELPVAHDFRGADVAAGGQGAPLVPIFHAALAAGLEKPLVVLNIGGVANVTYIGADGAVLACDTGPGNALLDDFCARHLGEPMDHDGRLASSGTPDEAVLTSLLSHPYFARPAPKSLDRQDFAQALTLVEALSPADGAATLAAFTARAAMAAPWPAAPLRVLVTGGGRHNPAIMAALRAAAACPVDQVEAVGWDGDALEAQCFAYLAARVVRGLPLSLPETTGVPRPLTGGRVTRSDGGPRPGGTPHPIFL
jgi:anhydro-N-acetylmuramic acid kinase